MESYMKIKLKEKVVTKSEALVCLEGPRNSRKTSVTGASWSLNRKL
jgi:hypothetical protein